MCSLFFVCVCVMWLLFILLGTGVMERVCRCSEDTVLVDCR